MQYKIAIADDHALFRSSLKLLLESFGDYKVVIEANDGKELLEKIKVTSIDFVLVDLFMPEENGFTAIEKVIQMYPFVKVLVLSQENSPFVIKRLLALGIHGYVAKQADAQQLKLALTELASKGFCFFHPTEDSKEYFEIIMSRREDTAIHFTQREIEIIKLTFREYNSHEIAKKLFITARTVEGHKKRMMEKTDSRNFIGVITLALKCGIITQEDFFY